MSDIKIGDIVKGNEMSGIMYGVTNNSSVCCVIRELDNDEITVLVLKDYKQSYTGMVYNVERCYFEKISYVPSDFQKWLINEYSSWGVDIDGICFNGLLCLELDFASEYSIEIRKQIKFDMPKTFKGNKVYKIRKAII
jgi:hypothetical protein